MTLEEITVEWCAVVKVLFSSNFLMRPCSMYLKSAFFDAIKIKLGNNKQK